MAQMMRIGFHDEVSIRHSITSNMYVALSVLEKTAPMMIDDFFLLLSVDSGGAKIRPR